MDVIPAILSSLLPQCNASSVTDDLSHEQVAIISLRNSFLKKYEPSGDNKDAERAAFDLFVESNTRCMSWTPNEQAPGYDTMLRARDRLALRLSVLDNMQRPKVSLGSCLNNLRPGPGSSIGTKYSDFVGKLFNSKLTTYDPALWHFYRDNSPTMWKTAELFRQSQYGSCEVVASSNMTFAKKNFDIARVINTEASLEMLFQLALGSQIEELLYEWFHIHLSKQPTINKALARVGSIDGSFATIDLKSASDLISLAFMEWFLPPRLFKTLTSVRAKSIKLEDGSALELFTFSTMGNGFTFPLQTLVFASIVEAVYLDRELPVYNKAQVPAFSVFGDDIICVSTAFDSVVETLGWCGFTVNLNKSFNRGRFRESCGGDFFKGRNVRGVYLRKLSHETHFFSIFNRISRWSATHGIDCTACLDYILSHIHHKWYVPFDVSDGAGIKVPSSLCKPTERGGLSFYTHYEPKALTISTRRYEHNPWALSIAMLGGYIQGTGQASSSLTEGNGALKYHSVFKPMPEKVPVGSLTLRSRPDGPPNVRRERSFTPSWDWIPQKDLTTLDYMFAFRDLKNLLVNV